MSTETLILYCILPILLVSMLMIFIRLFLGPSLMDKIIALDLLVIVGIGVISAYAVLYNKKVMMDISLVIAIIAFLSTVAFAMYYDKREQIKKNKYK